MRSRDPLKVHAQVRDRPQSTRLDRRARRAFVARARRLRRALASRPRARFVDVRRVEQPLAIVDDDADADARRRATATRRRARATATRDAREREKAKRFRRTLGRRGERRRRRASGARGRDDEREGKSGAERGGAMPVRGRARWADVRELLQEVSRRRRVPGGSGDADAHAV